MVGGCRQQAQWRGGIPLAAARVDVRGRSGFGVVPGDALLGWRLGAFWVGGCLSRAVGDAF